MQRREKLLLFGLLGALVLWKGAPTVQNALFGPLAERETQLRALADRISQQETDEMAVLLATKRLKEWKELSLPPDPLDAQRLYQEWLTNLAHLSGLSSLKVTPGRRVSQGTTYVGVQVAVDGEATLDQLATFLYHFHRIGLLHRIVQMKSESPTTQRDARLKVSLTAEGLSLRDAPQRERLFPEAKLAAEAAGNGTVWTVADAKGFPASGGFRVRIGHEYALVTEVAGNRWTVRRGVDTTTTGTHAAGERIELAPVNPAVAGRMLADYRTLLADSPFAKPAPHRSPQFAPVGEPVALRGTPWTLLLRVTDLDPSRGQPVFSFAGEAPAGMQIDSSKGEILWNPPQDVTAGAYPVTVAVRQGDAAEPLLSHSFRVTLRNPNQPPTLAAVPPQKLFLGRTLSFKVSADDDGPADALTLKLADGAPAGVTLDPATREIRWTPPDSLEPGEYKITVTATDRGEPPQSASLPVTVAVQEDTAAYTYLVASVVQDAQPEAWLYDRSNNRRLIVRDGSSFQIADIAGTVRKIGPDFLMLESAGQTWRLELGQTLRGMQPVPESPGALSKSPADQNAASPAEANPAG